MINRRDWFEIIASMFVTMALLISGFIVVNEWHAIVAWDVNGYHAVATVVRAAWQGIGYGARAYGRAVEWTVSTVTFKHVTLYGEPFHSARNGGFVSYDGWGHCFGFEWYGTPGFFHGCG